MRRSPPLLRASAICGLFLASGLIAWFFLRSAEPRASGSEGSVIAVSAEPTALDPDRPTNIRVGSLAFLAGFKLRSSDGRFGGLSGMAVAPDGRYLLAVSDRGYFVRLELSHRGDRLTGVTSGRIEPLIGEDGKSVEDKARDAEALALTSDGRLLIAFEGQHRILSYATELDESGAPGPKGAPIRLTRPPGLKDAEENAGVEALTEAKGGLLLALLESPLPKDSTVDGWRIDAKGATPISYRREPPFQPTDIARLPDGDLLVLERAFSPPFNLRARVVRIPRAAVEATAALSGEEIARISRPFSIDNMEALATRAGADGATLVYMLSDDNYSPFQRTLLLQFRLD